MPISSGFSHNAITAQPGPGKRIYLFLFGEKSGTDFPIVRPVFHIAGDELGKIPILAFMPQPFLPASNVDTNVHRLPSLSRTIACHAGFGAASADSGFGEK